MNKPLLLISAFFELCLLVGCGGGSPPPPPVATHFSVTAASASVTAGVAFNITVSALDATGAVVPSYPGTVHLTSTDGQAMLPADSRLANGTKTFSVMLEIAGIQTITATDTANPSVTGVSTAISVIGGPATHLQVMTPAMATAGAAFDVTVTAQDSANNAATTYSGTVHFTSTDHQAVLPPDSALASGAGTFSLTLDTTGNQTITATDTLTASITGTSAPIAVTVNPIPFINQPLSPDAVAPGGAGFTLTVTGTGFVATSEVHWNGSPRVTSVVSSSKLTASIQASDIASLGTALVTVVNPAPGGGTSNVICFQATNPDASVTLNSATVPVDGTPSAIATGDFNGDGKIDVAVTNSNNSVSILLGNGDGTFRPAVDYAVGGGPTGLAVGDFNGDGKLDLAVANFVTNDVSVLLGNGDGTFQPALTFTTAGEAEPLAVAVGDFNGDGKLDLAVANGFTNNVSVFLGNGDGTFQTGVDYKVGTLPAALAVGDFNADGKLDLAVANNTTLNVSILLGNGDGTFQPAVNFRGGGGSVVVGDFNGDGKLDLALANTNNPSGMGRISVLLGNGDGTFQTGVDYTALPGTDSIAVGDFNGDGRLDLAVANVGSNGVSVLLGNGDGTFQAPLNFVLGTQLGNSASVAAGDFNGDGKLDLAVIDRSASAIFILLQK